ncbi:unnamed protein product [Protopolystoma xenopodis]|uniref:Uncharacterized protein n=1 Tax=Protopolystoma xenopodis TaxID=117903 RepID=A0A3S5AJ40_9PLAT|nr:unnamed protein product [Protopolystoma xenopodis]
MVPCRDYIYSSTQPTRGEHCLKASWRSIGALLYRSLALWLSFFWYSSATASNPSIVVALEATPRTQTRHWQSPSAWLV